MKVSDRSVAVREQGAEKWFGMRHVWIEMEVDVEREGVMEEEDKGDDGDVSVDETEGFQGLGASSAVSEGAYALEDVF